MFSFFQRKPKAPEFRDVLFGDLPHTQWLGTDGDPEAEPWRTFIRAGAHLDAGRHKDAAGELRRVLAMPGLESRHYLQAWRFLRG